MKFAKKETFFINVCLNMLYSCEEELTVIKTAVMNSTKSKDFKLTQSTDEVVERIHNLHRYVNITLLVQLKYTHNFFLISR